MERESVCEIERARKIVSVFKREREREMWFIRREGR